MFGNDIIDVLLISSCNSLVSFFSPLMTGEKCETEVGKAGSVNFLNSSECGLRVPRMSISECIFFYDGTGFIRQNRDA